MDRRDFALGIGLGTLAFGGGAAAARSADPSDKNLPILDPAFNVKVVGRLQGDVSGKRMYVMRDGLVFGLVPGEGVSLNDYGRLMYRVQGCTSRESHLDADGTLHERSRSWLFYRDAHTGEYLQEFRNPFTGQTLPVPVFRAGISGSTLAPSGPVIRADFDMESSIFGKPPLLDWQFRGSRVALYRHGFTRWRENATGFTRTEFTLDSWSCDPRHVADTSFTHIPNEHSWTSQTEWQSWLGMRGKPGVMLWRNDSSFFSDVAELPEEFVTYSEKKLPGLFDAPLV